MRAFTILPLLAIALGSPVKRQSELADCLKDETCIKLGDMVIDKSEPIGGLSGTLDRKWPDGVVPYLISPEFTNNAEIGGLINQAIQKLNSTCLTFRPKQASDEQWIHYLPSPQGPNSCYTTLGYISWKSEKGIFLGQPSKSDFCFSRGPGTTIHETMHAVGFVHEQMRDDRDQYVKIEWQNMDPSAQSQYEKATAFFGEDFSFYGEKYDYESLMHYSPWQGAATGPTMTPIFGTDGVGNPIMMGQRDHMTQSDIDGINKMYEGSSGCSKVAG